MLGHRKLEVPEWIGILRRRAWIVAIPVVLCPIFAVVTTRFVQPRYVSQTLILVDQQKVPDEYVRSVVSADLDSRLSSMKEQILSRSRIQPIIERYNLYGDRRATLDEKIEIARKAINIKAIHSELNTPGGLPGFFISFTANDPRTAQAICGEITSLFVNENSRLREASAEGTTDFLKGQLDEAKHSLDEQDAKLAAFQRAYVGKLPGEESPNVNMLTSLNTQLEAANQSLSRMEQDRAYLQSMLMQVAPSTSSSGASAALQVPNAKKETRQTEQKALENQEAELATTYTADYPDLIAVRRKIAELKKQIAQMPDTVPANSSSASVTHPESASALQLRAQLRAADEGIASKKHEQDMLQQQVHIYQDRISSTPLVEQQYKQLTRDYETAKSFYEDLLNKMNQSKMATDLERRQEGEQFHVMDQPNLPDAPVFPNHAVFLASGFFLGLAIGLSIAALLEYGDTSLRTERDIWEFTRLPTLAIISLDKETETKSQGRNTKGKDGKSALGALVGAKG